MVIPVFERRDKDYFVIFKPFPLPTARGENLAIEFTEFFKKINFLSVLCGAVLQYLH